MVKSEDTTISISIANGPATNLVGPTASASASTSPMVISPIVSNSLSAWTLVCANSVASTSMFQPRPRIVQMPSKGSLSSRATKARVRSTRRAWHQCTFVIARASTSAFKLVDSVAMHYEAKVGNVQIFKNREKW